MAKRLTEKQIQEIVKLFISGISIDQLSEQFNCTKLTISRNLKKNLGEVAYEEYLAISKSNNKLIKYKKLNTNNTSKNDNKNNIKAINHDLNQNSNTDIEEQFFKTSEFIEIAPLNYDIEDKPQMDFSSIPIADIDFPKIVFMIVDKKVELEVKYLKDYPSWQFLSDEELNRKTIEIYFDLKLAKSFCNNDQKVIKVPNTNVFKKVAPILISRGITRIVSSDQIIAL